MPEEEVVDLRPYKKFLRNLQTQGQLSPSSRLLQRVLDEPDELPLAVLRAKLESWNDLAYDELSG
jgi:hypothetical protein